jgi:Nucleotidyl transferase AbiEii toxin, Type IV TA system
MEISHIFWEKATAIHVYCLQGKEKLAGRFSRHLHDLARLRETGHAAKAITARTVAETVAEHKAMFFRMKAADGSVIDYGRAVKGGLVLIPRGEDLDALRADYNFMIEEGLLLEDAHDFDDLITQCTALQKEANEAVSV